MKPHVSPWFATCVAAVLCAGFVWAVRMPLPFDGFVAVAAALLAFLGTLTLVAWMPRHWVWSDAEQLRLAFRAQHGVSEYAADSALQAIVTTHARASALRHAGRAMRDDVAERVDAVADRLDAAAREIFYAPDRHRDLRAILIRSELIEDAVKAHAALRTRNQHETENASRQKLVSALAALDAAFDQTELLAARGLLAEVEVASDVAETVLKPRRSLKT